MIITSDTDRFTDHRLTAGHPLTTLSLCLHSVQAYFWQFNPTTGECDVRPQLTKGGMASVWSVWSWVTELSVFGAVPVTILALNICVIAETRKMSARDLQLNSRLTITTIIYEKLQATYLVFSQSFYLAVKPQE